MTYTTNKLNFGKTAKKDKDKKSSGNVTELSNTSTGSISGTINPNSGTVKQDHLTTEAAQVSVDVAVTSQIDEPIVLEVEKTSVSNEHAEGSGFVLLDVYTTSSNLNTAIFSDPNLEYGTEIDDSNMTLRVSVEERFNKLVTILIQELGSGMRGGPEGLARTLRKANLI